MMRFHAAGKVDLEHIYTAADPRTYFSTLSDLDYQIPQQARPYFLSLIEDVRKVRDQRTATVVDIGCSYGINAALLRYGLSMDALYEHYCAIDPDASRDDVVALDRAWLCGRGRPDSTRFIGLDISAEALSYGLAAGLLNEGVRADLEHNELTAPDRARLGQADLVISTGCLGYVGERTLARVVLAAPRRPWLAHTLLRMYPAEPLVQCLDELGYETVWVDQPVRQRRFASAEEQSNVLDTLADLGVDPAGRESDGWLYARLFISRPRIA
jgi:carnitine O-acetyltransferase